MNPEDKKPEEPKTMPVLFIGGPHDGKRIDLEALPTTMELVYTQKAAFTALAEPLVCKALYRREAMRSASGLYPIYVFNEIPAGDIVYLLLDGYRESEDDRTPTSH